MFSIMFSTVWVDMKHNITILPFTLNRHKQNPEVKKASPSTTMSSGESLLFFSCPPWHSFLLLEIFLSFSCCCAIALCLFFWGEGLEGAFLFVLLFFVCLIVFFCGVFFGCCCWFGVFSVVVLIWLVLGFFTSSSASQKSVKACQESSGNLTYNGNSGMALY